MFSKDRIIEESDALQRFLQEDDGFADAEVSAVEGKETFSPPRVDRDKNGVILRIYGKQVEEEDPISSITLYLVPNEGSDADKLNFKYSAQNFEDEQLSLTLLFENPEFVSI